MILSILYQGCFPHSFSSSFSSNWFVQRLDKSSNPTLRFLFCCPSKEIKLKMKENAPIKIEIENSTKDACKLEGDTDIIIRIKISDCKVGWLWKKDFKLNINKVKCLKWRILSQPGRIGSGKNKKSLFCLLGLKITLRTCFESNNFSSNSCPELSNQVLSFSEGQIY